MPARKKTTTKLVSKDKVSDIKLVAVPKVKDVVGKVKRVKKTSIKPSAPSPESSVTESDKKIGAEERFALIQRESYLIAEKDGFAKHPDYYWHAAEAKLESENKI